MPKVNTLYNYFLSPKGVKPLNDNSPASKSKEKQTTPRREQREKGQTKLSLTKEKENHSEPKKEVKTETPKRKKPILKDKKETPQRKRSIDDEDSEEVSPVKPKRRRLIIPDDDSDSDDNFKPGSENEDSDSGSNNASESDPETPSEDESPQKKRKIVNKTPRATKNNSRAKKAVEKTPNTSQATSQESKPFKNPDSWPHLKYDFLEPNKIKDLELRKKDHENYNPRTVHVPNDFLNNQTPAMRQWWKLKSKNFDCVLFFKVGKFYELYHMDAVLGVNELNLSYMRGEFAHSGFPEIAYGRFSASLIEKGFKVARVEQTENPEMMSKRVAKMSKATKYDKVVNREICQISSKGTRVYTAQDGEITVPSSKYLLALTEKQFHEDKTPSYGICFLDTTIGDFYLGQFKDDRCNSRLLTLLAHYPPVHIIYERGNLSQSTLKILNGMLPSAIKEPLQKEVQFWSAPKTLKYIHEQEYFKNKESKFEWPKELKLYLNPGDSLGLTPAEDKELAVNALGGCVYLLTHYFLDQQLLAQARFKSYIPPDFGTDGTKFANSMVLDAITINNLKILDGEGSLMKSLDRCCTAFGKRLLREWICRPSCRKVVIIQRQEAVTELMERIDEVRNARSMMSVLPDLERLLSKIHAQGNHKKMYNHPDGRAIMFEGPIYTKRKIVDFITVLEGFEQILKIIQFFDEFKSDLIKHCTVVEPEGDFPELRKTLEYFKTAFDHEEAKKIGSIVPKKGVDTEYDTVLEELAHVEKDCAKYLEQQKKFFGVKVTYVGTDRKRFQLEVPDSQIKKVNSSYELQSQRKGFKRYYTDETKELLSRQISAEENRDKVLKDLNRRLFAKFSENYDLWNMAVYKIATLDVLMSLAEYSASEDTCIPTIFDDSDDKTIIEIIEGKHPCIVSDNFIPNDTTLATNGVKPLVILTGPNMGGKSTLMRQLGLIVIMAQIGCQVPASSCSITLIDRIFTRLGANDDIMAGQSTFLVELSETSAILQHATPYSLVLLDELGRGTSTYDGTAIAAAVVDALTKMKCRTLFSTHYHSLVEDYKTNENVTLAHMACMVESEEEDVSQETVTFLYKLSEGACPKSYGFNAARLAGVPSYITQKAHEVAKQLERETNLRHIFASICKLNDESNVRTMIEAI
ncbi:probable DNA mismatch repair protein Msh6 [Leptopilina heterotoma]|uniref:probable DNA mismatch repair protein Msh6 n=1 Tax=Leptopilina heterotoma TaxID=63436 RepID=UPI001CA936BA|nr:probable DNA mismatch repair protein Msh6 [Leptopilina heterotoma]